ncbi:MAG: hypothetical protein ACXQTI_10685 [Candidatus Nezhaarchaeales archaeon]
MSERTNERALTSYMIRFRIGFCNVHPHKLLRFFQGLRSLFSVQFLPNGYIIVHGRYLVGVLHYYTEIHSIGHYVPYHEAETIEYLCPPLPKEDLVISVDGKIEEHFDSQRLYIIMRYVSSGIEGRVAITIDPYWNAEEACKELYNFLRLAREYGIYYEFDLLRPM